MDLHSSEDQSTDLSTQSTYDDNSAASSTADTNVDANANSSSADEGDKKILTPVDAVTAALDELNGKPKDSPALENNQENQTDPKKEEKSDDVDGNRFDKHPRFQELIKERDGAKAELETYKADAQALHRLDKHLSDAGISAEEFNTLVHVGELMKKDPEKALQAIIPYFQGLQQVTGRVLPPDIQEQYSRGYLTQEAAQELARTRARAQFLEQRQVESEEAARTAYEQQQAYAAEEAKVQLVDQMKQAANRVEAHWQATDPGYEKIKPLVTDRTARILLRERPQTPEHAAEIVRRARKEIDDELRGVMPRKPSVRTVTGGGSGTVAPTLRSSLDAVTYALEQGR